MYYLLQLYIINTLFQIVHLIITRECSYTKHLISINTSVLSLLLNNNNYKIMFNTFVNLTNKFTKVNNT